MEAIEDELVAVGEVLCNTIVINIAVIHEDGVDVVEEGVGYKLLSKQLGAAVCS